MGRYISLPISVDPAELLEQARDTLQSLVPGWQPSPGNLDDWILQTTARLAADLREFARDIPEEIFRYFGEEILLVSPLLPSYASFESTWTAVNDDGYLIPAGTVVGVRKSDGDLAAFQTVQDYSIPSGFTTATGVVLMAVDPGAEASGLVTTSDVVLVDALPWVQSIVGTTPTGGGVDGETVDEYMDRLVDFIRLMSPRPIIPSDYSIMVKRIAGIDRGYPLNLYDADTDTSDVERAITVVVTDENGELVSAQAKTDAEELLESMREVNMLIFVRDPQYKLIDIVYEVMAMPGVDAAGLETAIDDALAEYISPIHWGEVRQGTDVVTSFRVNNVVRYLEVANVINNVDGVDYIEDLTIGFDGGAQGTADLTMTGAGVPVFLPRVDTITATVNEPT